MLALIILCILFTWLLCAAVCIGIGSLLLRAIFQSSDLQTFQRFSLLHSFWTGIAIITAILQLYHFLRPIDLVAVLLLEKKKKRARPRCCSSLCVAQTPPGA